MLQAFALQSFKVATMWLLAILLVMLALLCPAITQPVQAATDDTPTPFVTDDRVRLWTIGSGLAYWGYNCAGVEVPADFDNAGIQRRATTGGNPRKLDATPEDDASRCLTYRNMMSSDNGLYFVESTFDEQGTEHPSIMRMRTSAPFNPVTVKALALNEVPTGVREFVEANGYLYWMNFDSNRILRTLKNGSGEIETVADTNPSPLDMIVVGTRVYWTDRLGVWSKSFSCATLPCEGVFRYEELSGSAIAYGLVYKFVRGNFANGDGFRLYWVEQTGNAPPLNYRIVYRACNLFTEGTCFLTFAPDPPNPTPEPEDPVPFHASSSNRVIGLPLLVNNDIFWTEFETTVSGIVVKGDINRKAFNALITDPPGTLLTDLPGLDNQLYAVNDKLYFAQLGIGLGISTIPLNAAPIVRDFELKAVEVTQGIQNFANDVPLVAGKTTYVRVYATQVVGPNAPNVEVQLVGKRNGVNLSVFPLKPINGVRGLVTGQDFNRNSLNSSWYFLLPEYWTDAGAITLEVAVDPRPLHNDPTRPNNNAALNINFQSQPPVCVMTVPVRTHTPKVSVYDPNFGTMVSLFDRLWPVPETWIFADTSDVAELEFCSWHGIPYPCFGPYELEDGWGLTNGIPDRDKVIVSLWTRAQLSFNPDMCDDIDAPVHFMGMVHPDANNGGAGGYASTVSNQSWVQLPPHEPIGPAWNALREGSTMAQELAHNHGRKHVNCGSPDNVDDGFPYSPCQIADGDAASYFGFDVATRQVILPNFASDFMSYGGSRWVSDYTWRALLDKFASSNVAATTAMPLAEGEQVFVTGMVDGETERGEITQLLILPAESLPPATRQRGAANNAAVAAGLSANVDGVAHGDEPHVAYKLRLLDADGETVIERPLTLLPLDDHTGESQAMIFMDLFPKPAPAVATVHLLGDGTPIYTVTAGLNVPVVTVQEPVAGAVIANQMSIKWIANDPDVSDRLKFTVQYSHDNGASWHTIAINLPSTPNPVNTLVLDDLGALHGSATNAAKIRVLATDGYNTKIAESQGFTVQNRPPVPIIYSPANDGIVAGGEAVLLQGAATDPEDGGLDEDALQWQVDGAINLTGTVATVAGLASGAHSASLSAIDANDQRVTTTVSFEIAPVAIPLGTQPTMDGACSDAAYASALNLPLRAYGEASQSNVAVIRSPDYLWLCFTDLALGAASPEGYVGLRADVDSSRDANAQTDDFGFFVSEDGSVFTRQGDNAGDLVEPGPDGAAGQIILGDSSWSAELRIEKAKLGGWDHLINIAIGHHSVNGEDDDYAWPYLAQWGKPTTWSTAALGIQPLITRISPTSAPSQAASVAAVDASMTLTVEGSGFVSGTQVLWNDAALPTTLITDGVLSAVVDSAKLSTPGKVTVTVRSPAPGNFVSSPVQFIVEGPTPVINSFSPAQVQAESAAFQLTINGSNFAPDATVLWNGIELTPQFVNASQLKVQIAAALLENGQTVGIIVGNPTPDAKLSANKPFTITAITPEQPDESFIYMPTLSKEE